jgi:glutamate synthase (ferredoxin)
MSGSWRNRVDHDACGVGFIAQLGGASSREVVERALTALARLSHRGGLDADGLSGDGAGLLTPIPRDFFRKRAGEAGIDLPESFALGMTFLPPGEEAAAVAAIESIAQTSGLRCLGWREVPTDPSLLGPRAKATVPTIRQCFFALQDARADFERTLYFFRKRVETEGPAGIYFCSLSSRAVVYKGLMAPVQFREFFADLASPEFTAPFAMFHQRYSTNTQPTWRLAQPFRFVAHNGEINTIGANRRWVRAREKALRQELGAPESFRVLEERASDSASFDNGYEVLLHRGYGPAAAVLRMVPPAWESDRTMTPDLRRYFEAQVQQQEPWDGPAALVFSDGQVVGAKLDRNGLRPLRYTVTSEGLIVCGSETGLTDLQSKHVSERQRLGPGEILLVDPAIGGVFRGNDLSGLLTYARNGGPYVPPQRITALEGVTQTPTAEPKKLASALGWTDDQFKLLFVSLGTDGKEATWSMGDDAPPAFASSMHRPIWDYCKQRFAQVTNPAIDPLRESHVMSLDVYLGHNLVAGSPILDAGQAGQVESLLQPACRIDITFEAAGGVSGAIAALDRIRKEAATAAKSKPAVVVLSDRTTDSKRASLPAMLATAAVWKEMVRGGAYDTPLLVETGQVIETHHIAMLVAVGASVVCPYIALELSEALKPGGAAKYRVAVEAGLRKVLARMGISTIASYRNSHLFEAVGLDDAVVDAFFEDAATALGGKTLESLLEDTLWRHARAYGSETPTLHDEGLYRFRQTGERHASSPELVRRLHKYVKAPTPEGYRAYAELAETREPVAVRDLLEFVPGKPIALEEVESEASILARFSTQAMSLGALGPEAHRTLAIGMNRLGARSNTGEGGEDPDIYRFEPEANNKIKQVASARFGVTAEYLSRADELEIKMSQGSKPGEGGQLPAAKVNSYIARLRHAVPGMSLISPPPHHDIYSIEDLAQLIWDLRSINPTARIGVKLVSGDGVGIIAAGVAKAGADVITIAGFDGGTGASPLTSIKNTGLPGEVGLRDAHNALMMTGFRSRVRLRSDGGFKFGRDVIIAAMLGADEFGFGTASLLAIGCVMARQCHLNTCPAGIATQDETMRARFAGNPEMVVAYFRGVAGEVRERLAALGARSLDEISGAVNRLKPRSAAAERSLGTLLETVPAPTTKFPEALRELNGLQAKLLRAVEQAKSPSKPIRFPIANSDRTIGAYLSGQILRRSGYAGLREATIDCEFRGSAGQSFGAFAISGLRLRLLGEANDYVGKGLSGGTIAITAGVEASRRGDVLAGNTCLYGATSGQLYIAGRAGERFAVRNSGALAVIEGVGHHGCEYMTSGIAVILGPAGVNMGSGMTGGLIYMLRKSVVEGNYNREFVRCTAIEDHVKDQIDEQEEAWLRRVLAEHFRLTGSPRAKRLLKSDQLPLVRIEPVHLPCPISQTWEPIIARLERQEVNPLEIADPLHAEDAQQPVEPC